MVGKKMLAGLVLLANLAFLLVCVQAAFWQKSPDYDIKLRAAEKARAAQQIIGPRLTGEEYTSITTTLGAAAAKKLAAHPDFAAVTVEMLTQAGVGAGDVVALNMSGSFPALNIAAIAAVDAMGAQPVIISSVGASTWGANRPEYTWLDMEKQLVAAGVWPWHSQAAGRGGGSDMGRGLTPEGIKLLDQALKRSGVPVLQSTSVDDAIAKRLAVYRQANQGKLPRALINVGGSHVIFGEHGHDAFLKQGLTMGYQPSLAQNTGLAAAFLSEQRPVLHFINIQRLAAAYHLQEDTPIGSSRVYYQTAVPMWLRLLIVCWLSGMGLLFYKGKEKGWWTWTN